MRVQLLASAALMLLSAAPGVLSEEEHSAVRKIVKGREPSSSVATPIKSLKGALNSIHVAIGNEVAAEKGGHGGGGHGGGGHHGGGHHGGGHRGGHKGHDGGHKDHHGRHDRHKDHHDHHKDHHDHHDRHDRSHDHHKHHRHDRSSSWSGDSEDFDAEDMKLNEEGGEFGVDFEDSLVKTTEKGHGAPDGRDEFDVPSYDEEYSEDYGEDYDEGYDEDYDSESLDSLDYYNLASEDQEMEVTERYRGGRGRYYDGRDRAYARGAVRGYRYGRSGRRGRYYSGSRARAFGRGGRRGFFRGRNAWDSLYDKDEEEREDFMMVAAE